MRRRNMTGQLVSSLIALFIIWYFPLDFNTRLICSGLILAGLILKLLILRSRKN